MAPRFIASAWTAMIAAFGSSVCCAGPTVAAALGFSGAGLVGLLPFRPYLVIVGAVALWAGFAILDREDERACVPGTACADAATRARMRHLMWLATGFFVLFGTAPLWVRAIL